jgi:hypothetical protein
MGDNTDPESGSIRINEREIPTNYESFQQVLGIPAGKLPVELDVEAGKAMCLEYFGLSEIPTIRFFGDKIMNEKDLPDAELCRCFMSVALGAFICPTSCTRPSSVYMGALVDVNTIKDHNWRKFAYEWPMFYLKKYISKRQKNCSPTLTLGGYIYHQAVYLSTTYIYFFFFDSLCICFSGFRLWFFLIYFSFYN